MPPSGMLREGGAPSEALLAPLALLFILYSRTKKRGGLDTIIILVVLGVALSFSLAACTFTNHPVPGGTVTGTATPTPNGTVTATGTFTPNIPGSGGTPSAIPSVTCTATLTPGPTPTITPTPFSIYNTQGGQLFLQAVQAVTSTLNADPNLNLPKGFSVPLLLAMGGVEGGDQPVRYDNSGYGGVLQVKNQFNRQQDYGNTLQGYENNVQDAIRTINYFYPLVDQDPRAQAFASLTLCESGNPYYRCLDSLRVRVARTVLYYNMGLGWSQLNGYASDNDTRKQADYVDRVRFNLSNHPFGYSDDALIDPLYWVQVDVSCTLIKIYHDSSWPTIHC